MEQIRLKGSKYGVYKHVAGQRVTQESVENQNRTLGLILGHFLSPMPKFDIQFSGPITLDLHIILRWKLKHKFLIYQRRDPPQSHVNP